jgi:Na+/melibiose symporter-like transporter
MRNLNDGYGIGERSGLNSWWGLFWAVAAIAVFLALIVPDPVRTVSQARIYAWGSIVMFAVEALWCWVAADLVKAIAAAEAKSLNQG